MQQTYLYRFLDETATRKLFSKALLLYFDTDYANTSTTSNKI